MYLTQEYTDATGTTHPNAYFVPLGVSISLATDSIVVSYSVYHDEDAYRMGLQPVSLSARPGPRRPGTSTSPEQRQFGIDCRVVFDGNKHPLLMEAVKEFLTHNLTQPVQSRFTQMQNELTAKLEAMRSK